MGELQKKLDANQIRYFKDHELLLLRREGRVAVEPTDILHRIIPTVTIADSIRHGFGAPVTVVSGYRPEEYNAATRNASPVSEHVNFRALDLRPSNQSRMEEFRKIAIAVVDQARRLGLNVALIHYNNFVHIDVGSRRRRNLDKDMR